MSTLTFLHAKKSRLRSRKNATPVHLVLMLGALLGVLLATVVPAAGQETPKILRIWGWEEMPENLEPQTNEFGNYSLALLNYEGLTRFDEELNVVPGAAESWEFSADGLTITFHLRANLTYSDGSPLTAERFRYAIERRCDPHFAYSGAEEIFEIAGCEAFNASLDDAGEAAAGNDVYETARANLGVRALDDRTLEIRLVRPAPYFPAVTQWLHFAPVKQELVEAGGPEWWREAGNWVSNGPFQVSAIELEADTPHVSLVANEHYWGGRAKLDGIVYPVLDGDAATAAYERGDLDMLWLNTDDLPAIEADPVRSRELVTLQSPFVGLFNLNMTREPFQDKKVREAFAYAFDREAYCREQYRGSCTPVLSWIPPWVPGSIESDAYAFDPRRAREALAASTYGGPDGLPEIVWQYDADDPDLVNQATWLVAQFREVLGFELTLKAVSQDELDAMFGDAATYPQIAESYWWSGLLDPHEWMRWWTCGDPSFAERYGYCNPAYDALVERAGSELDPQERIRLAEESQRLLVADAPAIFTYRWDVNMLVKPYVAGYSPTAPYQEWPGWWTPLTLDIVPSS